MAIAYTITNKTNGKVYVGFSSKRLNRRWARHLAAANSGDNRPLYRAIRRDGPDAFHVAEIFSGGVEYALQAERDSIRALDSMNRAKGYNLSSGGDRPSLSDEAIAKMRASQGSPEMRA